MRQFCLRRWASWRTRRPWCCTRCTIRIIRWNWLSSSATDTSSAISGRSASSLLLLRTDWRVHHSVNSAPLVGRWTVYSLTHSCTNFTAQRKTTRFSKRVFLVAWLAEPYIWKSLLQQGNLLATSTVLSIFLRLIILTFFLFLFHLVTRSMSHNK